MAILEQIKQAGDIKKVARKDLPQLAEEIRARIIDVVSRNGGHLASSLGTVELTLALHHVFDFPKDHLVWDVGHQAYAHKILTGRNDKFDTLRQYKGLSGFCKSGESSCDSFTVGHASTSISAGLGMCAAKQLTNDDSHVICVIGDGAMSAGLAYEGLNQAGHLKQGMIVILNDNDMSISPNVGAVSSLLSRTFSAPYMQAMRNHFGNFLKSLPKIGDDVYGLAKRWEESVKTFMTPGMLFEGLNFDYFGPIDGHNLDHLIDILSNIKNPDSPILLHVTTQKGKGYDPAEKNPVNYHGVGPFCVETGQSASPPENTPPTYTRVFGSWLVEKARQQSNMVAITAAMPEGTGLTGFAAEFPDRFFDVGIAEQHAVTFAAGLAARGMRPVVAIYSTFLQRAYDQILHDVCIDNYPVVFAIDRGGIVGDDGPTHHGLFDFSYLRNIPNMTIMAPSNENEFARMLETAISHDGPIALRYPRGNAEGVRMEDPCRPVPIGKAKKVKDGGDLVILAIGRCVNDALAAANLLEEEGIHVCVVDARFVKPLDADLILALARTIPKMITVEEHVLDGGFGSAVLELLADNFVMARVHRMGIGDEFVEHGSQAILRQLHKLDVSSIVKAARKIHEL